MARQGSAGEEGALVTGAAGFLGRHICSALAAEGFAVTGVDRLPILGACRPGHRTYAAAVQMELTSSAEVRRLIADRRIQLCVHLAGPADVGVSMLDPAGDFEAHCRPLLTVLDGVRNSVSPPRVLLVSSAAVYGDPESLPVAEDGRIKPLSPYGFHKRMQELLVEEYSRVYSVPCCTARVFSTFGEGLRHLAVWDICRRALSGDCSIRGSGEESRDYLYVGDVARAIDCLAKAAPFEGEIINVASGEETPIIDLARLIYECLGIVEVPRLIPDDASRGNPRRWQADVARLRALGFEPAFKIEDGLRRTVEWIRGNA